MIVAWHEVPGTAPPQKSRPVGHGLIRAGCAHLELLRPIKPYPKYLFSAGLPTARRAKITGSSLFGVGNRGATDQATR